METPRSDRALLTTRWIVASLAAIGLSFLLIALLPQPAEPGPATPKPHGHDLPQLATVESAGGFHAPRYVEAVLRNGRWSIYQDGVPVCSGDTDEAATFLETLFPDNEPEPHGPLLISAGGSTMLRDVIPIARPAMNGGGHGAYFLVAEGQGVGTVHLRSSGVSSIDPVFIHLGKDGNIQAGTGSSARDMDSLDDGPPFPDLDEALDVFSAAAAAVGAQGIAMLAADSTTPLQDFLTLAAHIGSHDIRVNMTPEWSARESAPTAARPAKKPSSPSSPGSRVIRKHGHEREIPHPVTPDR